MKSRRGSVSSVSPAADAANARAAAIAKQPPTKAKGVSITLVVAVISALIVLVVASITFTITYTTSLKTVQAVGERYARALVGTALVKTEEAFAVPAKMALALKQLGKTEGMMLPADDPTDFLVLNKTINAIMGQVLTLGLDLVIASMTFDDGSLAATRFYNDSVLIHHVSNARPIAGPGATTGAIARVTDLHWPSMRPFPTNISGPTEYGDTRVGYYTAVRDLVRTMSTGFWVTPIFWDQSEPNFFLLPCTTAMHNSSGHLLGIVVLGVAFSSVTQFMRDVELTPGAHMFMLDKDVAVAATTHPAEFITVEPTTLFDSPERRCASSAGISPPSRTQFTMACRAFARDFPFPAVQRASAETSLTQPTVGQTTFMVLDVNGATYYAAAAAVQNQLRTMPFSLLLLVPQSDVLGDIVRSRNVVIAIVCCVMVAAMALTSVIIFLVMRPLQEVSRRMQQTARLKDVADNEDISLLKEVADLQISFRRLNSAIGSFTRYVPRDVVKDLMRSGQLCEIRMYPTRCSTLFVDIAGFTTLCERVPPDELSGLIYEYFDAMSKTVIRHAGLIDKFIGDCIMAVWGAPFPVPSAEVRATLCGLLIDRATRVDPLLTAFDNAGEVLSVRVGIASGVVLAGNMGTEERMNYTVIGDPVNLAARLESMNKQFGTRVSVCEDTASHLRNIFCLRLLMKIAVVGRNVGVKVFEVVGLANTPDVDHDILAIRTEEAAATKDANTSDTASVMTADSAGGTAVDTKESTTALIDAARRLTPNPVTVGDDAARAAAQFTRAAQLYIDGKFTDALQRLADVNNEALVSSFGGNAGVAFEPKSVAILRDCVNDAIQSPPAPGEEWDGTWRASDK